MCVSAQPARFSSTILYAHRACLERRWVHVLGYQNRASSAVAGPNAMLLPIPTSAPLGPDNMIDMRPHADLLRRYVRALRPVAAKPPSLGPAPRSIQVFERGSYAIVLARDAELAAIGDALAGLPDARRPHLAPELLDFYLCSYPGWHLAICCFSGEVEPEPIVWWYEPLHVDALFLPGVDAHDGKPPRRDQLVALDHSIVVGRPRGLDVALDLPKLPNAIAPLFATTIEGVTDLRTRARNGDWWMRHDEPIDPRARQWPGADR